MNIDNMLIKLHPAIVHFPVALLFLAGAFGLISLFIKRNFWKGLAINSLIFGTLLSLIAVLTGLIEEQILKHNDAIHKILVIHKLNGLVILFFSLILCLWLWFRRKSMSSKEYVLFAALLFIGSMLVTFQGYLGGKMVFEHGAGVKPMESLFESEEKTEHHKEKHSEAKKEMNKDSKKDSIENHSNHRQAKDSSVKKKPSGQQHNVDSAGRKKELKDMKY
jgi:uncharacterized membrane protein